MTTVEERVTRFSGLESDWPWWSFETRAEVLQRGLLSEQEMEAIESSSQAFPIPSDPASKERSANLYYYLVKACSRGKAGLILRRVARGN